MPVGANLRVFKSDIQPVWEDDANKDGGNWLLVPSPKEVIGVAVFKELLLAIIGGELDAHVNGIVLSMKPNAIVTQLWLPNARLRNRNQVQKIANNALKKNCPRIFTDEEIPVKPTIEWTWRVHPTAAVVLKPLAEGERASDRGRSCDVIPGEGLGPGQRGMCGECMDNRCHIM